MLFRAPCPAPVFACLAGQLFYATVREQPPLRGGPLRHLHPHRGQLHPVHAHLHARQLSRENGHHRAVAVRPLWVPLQHHKVSTKHTLFTPNVQINPVHFFVGGFFVISCTFGAAARIGYSTTRANFSLCLTVN